MATYDFTVRAQDETGAFQSFLCKFKRRECSPNFFNFTIGIEAISCSIIDFDSKHLVLHKLVRFSQKPVFMSSDK